MEYEYLLNANHLFNTISLKSREDKFDRSGVITVFFSAVYFWFYERFQYYGAAINTFDSPFLTNINIRLNVKIVSTGQAMEISKTCFGKKKKNHKNPFSSEIYRVYIGFFFDKYTICFLFF